MNRKVRLFFISAAVFCLALLYFFVDARKVNSVLPRCVFNSVTGFYCPGCGSQRAISALLHGDFIGALHFNILMVACLPLLIYSAIVFILNTFGKKQIVQKIFYSTAFIKIFFLIVVMFWIMRNIPVYPFNLLAPHE